MIGEKIEEQSKNLLVLQETVVTMFDDIEEMRQRSENLRWVEIRTEFLLAYL
jgi:hypothetical protein